MFNTEVLDSAFQSLAADDNTSGMISNDNYNKNNRKFTNILLTRLCIYSLLRLQEDFRSSSSRPLLPGIVIANAGNTWDFYQFCRIYKATVVRHKRDFTKNNYKKSFYFPSTSQSNY